MTGKTESKEPRGAEWPQLPNADDPFLRVFQLSPSPMAISTIAEGQFLFVNEAFVERTGYSLEEVIGRTSRELNIFLHYSDRSTTLEKLRREGTARNVRADVRTKSGAVLKGFFHAQAIPFQGENCLLTLFHDTTGMVDALQALTASEEKYRTLAESSPEMIYVIDKQGVVQYVNSAGLAQFGGESSLVVGKHVRELYPPAIAERHMKAIAGVIDTGRRLAVELLEQFPTDARWIDARISPIRDGAGAITGVLGMSQDITERKQAEEKYRNLFETSQDAIFVVDRTTHRFVGANQAACRMYGYSQEEFLRMRDVDVSAEPEQTVAAIEQGAAVVPVRLHRKKDGTVFPVEIAGGYFTLAGRPLHTASIRDITDRRRSEQALRESEERFRAIFEQASVGIAMADGQLGFSRVNGAFCTMLGYGEPELAGMTLMDIIHPDDWATDGESLQKLRRGELRRHHTEKRYLKKGGGELWGELSVSALHGASGDFLHYLVVMEDISARKRAEEELQRTEKIESLRVFAGGVAHDFNNLLGGLFGYLDLARQELPQGHPAYEYLDKSFSAFERAKSLARQMLTFAKGGAPLKKPVRVAEMLRDSCSLALSGSNIRCEYHVADDLWLVDGDEHQLAQVFSNLVINAWQAMPDGGRVTITAENHGLAAGQIGKLPAGRYVAVAVRDEGIGIPENLIDKVFDPFFTTKQRGSGLGLATSYSIVARHGGYISVASRPATGSVFTVFLPAAEPAERHQPEATVVGDLHGSGRVLVMDDEHVIREMVRDILTRYGYEVAVTAEGRAAVAAYGRAMNEDQRYDLVILDLTVPGGVGGAWTLRELKKIDPQVVAIVSSGYSDNAELTRFDEHGFSGMVAKPYRTNELLLTVKRAMAGKPGNAGGPPRDP